MNRWMDGKTCSRRRTSLKCCTHFHAYKDIFIVKETDDRTQSAAARDTVKVWKR